MAKRHNKKRPSSSNSEFQNVTLREQNVGRKNVSTTSMLKIQHLQRLATWAGGEASIPSLAALFGRRLSATAEAEGVPLDRSIFTCRRCETILQPGRNCTVRIKKKTSAKPKSHRSSGVSQNELVYKCNFCSYQNSQKGTPMAHMKELSACRPVGPIPVDSSSIEQIQKASHGLSGPLNLSAGNLPLIDHPQTPTSGVNVRSSANRKGDAVSSGVEGSVSGKRRRKKWSTVKEIAMSSEREREQRITNLAIPFMM
ncbi:RNase P Rpr2/Rpp21 subunit domain protein [Wolffia australiana]